MSDCSAYNADAYSGSTYAALDRLRDLMTSSQLILFTGIGQMVGDTTNGIWNESEGISLIFKVSRSISFLPTRSFF